MGHREFLLLRPKLAQLSQRRFRNTRQRPPPQRLRSSRRASGNRIGTATWTRNAQPVLLKNSTRSRPQGRNADYSLKWIAGPWRVSRSRSALSVGNIGFLRVARNTPGGRRLGDQITEMTLRPSGLFRMDDKTA